MRKMVELGCSTAIATGGRSRAAHVDSEPQVELESRSVMGMRYTLLPNLESW